MAKGTIIEVKYFNSFVLRKVLNDSTADTASAAAVWNGSRAIPNTEGGYPQTGVQNDNNWSIEESRIRGGYNNTQVSLGARAYAVEEESQALFRVSSLIYSGIYNSRTGINQTNVFSVAEDITKSLDPAKGSIQKLHAEDTNLNIFQENKVSRALIDKDAIYTAEGSPITTSSNLVIGQVQPYTGEYGISNNPESFAVYGYQKYFSDKNRNVIMRLSRDGLTEISNYGMSDFFRDKLSSLSDSGKVIGGYDIHNKQYVVSIQSNPLTNTGSSYTLSFDEGAKGWVSFFSYKPGVMTNLQNVFYSFINTASTSELYSHYSSDVPRCNFYGINNDASIKFIFNPKVSTSKVFKAINYEGSNGWEVTSFQTGADLVISSGGYIVDGDELVDVAAPIYSYNEGEFVLDPNSTPTSNQPVPRADYFSTFGTNDPALSRYHAGFNRKEGKYMTNIINTTPPRAGEVSTAYGIARTGVKGYFSIVELKTDSTTNYGGLKELFAVSSEYVESAY